jgi:D-alanyl-D-alanine dipeptidase
MGRPRSREVLLLCGFLMAILPATAEVETPASLFGKRLPPVQGNVTALNYHEIPIDLDDPRDKEPLVVLKDYGIAGEAFYARNDGLNFPYQSCICPQDGALKARKSVAEKLHSANVVLSPLGLEVFVLDSYRPVSCQKKLWDFFLAEAKRMLGPSATPEQLVEYAGKFCSNPTSYDAKNFKTWPTHLTGGAVDLTLRRVQTGELLYMGGIFDDASDISVTRNYENSPAQDSPASAVEAQRNRRLLYWIMTAEGFANYPNEWWHFDYGNQMWVKNRDAKQSADPYAEHWGNAFYGAI